MASEIGRLVDAKLVRVLDLLILQKAEDGTVEALEVDDLDEVDELRAAEAQLAELLAEEDVVHLAAAMEPGLWPACWSGRTAGPHRLRPPPAAPEASSSPPGASPSKPSSPH